MRILGLDPSLSSTGWGVIEVNANRLQYVADGFIPTSPKMPIEERLDIIFNTLSEVIETYQPVEAAIEKTFPNSNPETSLKLSMARGVVITRIASVFNLLQRYIPQASHVFTAKFIAEETVVRTVYPSLFQSRMQRGGDIAENLTA